MGERQRKRLLSTRAQKAGDVLPNEFVQLTTGGPVGFVTSITDDFATVLWLHNPGHRDILACGLLVRVDQ